MIESLLQMLGIGPAELENLKTGLVDFEKRFAALEAKIDFIHTKHSDTKGNENANTIAE